MILGTSSDIYGFQLLMDDLQRASRGVVYLEAIEEGRTGSICTGWQITGDLIVAPWFAGSDNADNSYGFFCRFADTPLADAPIPVTMIPIAASNDDELQRFVLFRLPQVFPDRALRLCLEQYQLNDRLFLLQYIGGEKVLKISTGHLVRMNEQMMWYDADTEPGSGGAPVLNIRGQVMGAHSGRSGSQQRDNFGISLNTLFERLRGLPAEWAEIVRYHNLADLSAVQAVQAEKVTVKKEVETAQPVLLQAALQWYVHPGSFSEADKEELRPLMIDGHPDKWAMKLEDRQRVIKNAGSLANLQKAWKKIQANGNRTKRPSHGGVREKVINGILEGPPYKLEAIAEAELPYWLQAVRWFDTLIPGLPQPSAIHLSLEQRRMRSRLSQVAGPDFSGRLEELDLIAKWYEQENEGPLLITGIGGVGKSSLISKFVLNQPYSTVFFWLDFDRADLSPDDAISVLTAIDQQAQVQLDNYEPMKIEGASWENRAEQLGAFINRFLPAGHPPVLMVLDGFEVAQHAKKYNEIWQVLEKLMLKLSDLKVIVSGRAPVKSLQLNGRKAVPLPLKGMDESAAASWLRAHHITEENIIKEVFRISRGVPLILRLAARLVEKGGSVLDLPQTLPESMVEGYLYQRILDRVIDPLLHPLAKDLLVVRKVTLPMLEKTFINSIPANMTPAEVFDSLKREMGLVNEADPGTAIALAPDSGELHLRSEVRSATLKLLELENPAQVKAIHEKAVDFYLDIQPIDNLNRAELVYHYLQLGDLIKAAHWWNEECRILLADAEADFGEKSVDALHWLRAKMAQPAAVAGAPNTKGWEQDALGRIKDAMLRGLMRIVPDILKEQANRSEDSALLVYDALQLLNEGNTAGAEQLLFGATTATGMVQEQRNVLKALVARRLGKHRIADEMLLQLEPAAPDELTNWPVNFLLVRAARVRGQVLPDLEVALGKVMKSTEGIEAQWMDRNLLHFLTPADVVSPGLCNLLFNVKVKQESFTARLPFPAGPGGLQEFRALINRKRTRATGYKYEVPSPNASLVNAEAYYRSLLEKRMEKITREDPLEIQWQQLILQLGVAGLKKWMLATNDLFMFEACKSVMERRIVHSLTELSLLSAFAALRGESIDFSLFKAKDTDEFVDAVVAGHKYDRNLLLTVSDARLALFTNLILLEGDTMRTSSYTDFQANMMEQVKGQPLKSLPLAGFRELPTDFFSVMLLILGPDPLDELCRHLLSLPPDYPL